MEPAARIAEELKRIETSENVRILYAVESGSRAWGFASPDSDYDVRFIYVRPRDYYLRLDATQDVLEYPIDDDLDISGWDLQKALRLLHVSNPTFFEWCNSPIAYRRADDWQQVSRLVSSYFLLKPALYHYLSMATSNYRKYLTGEQVRLKKYFYAIRPILACKWILANKTPPPMLFDTLRYAVLEPEMSSIVEALLAKKTITSELGETAPIAELNAYIESSLADLASTLDKLPPQVKPSWEPLNALFRSMLT
jgi:predicted nucleotidyltransferase